MSKQLPVLVYGTLRPGQGNYYHFLEGRTLTERNVTLDGFRMYAGLGFPYVIAGRPEESIVATLIDIDPEQYEDTVMGLDMLEGYHGPGQRNHYDREEITFTDENGEVITASMYVAHVSMYRDINARLPILPGGDWVKHVEEKRAERMSYTFDGIAAEVETV